MTIYSHPLYNQAFICRPSPCTCETISMGASWEPVPGAKSGSGQAAWRSDWQVQHELEKETDLRSHQERVSTVGVKESVV